MQSSLGHHILEPRQRSLAFWNGLGSVDKQARFILIYFVLYQKVIMPVSTTLLFATGALLIWGVKGCKLFNCLYLKNLLISRQLLESLCSLSWNTVGESLYISAIAIIMKIRYGITMVWLSPQGTGKCKVTRLWQNRTKREDQKIMGSQISHFPDTWVWTAFNWKYLVCSIPAPPSYCSHPHHLIFSFSVLVSAACLLHLSV